MPVGEYTVAASTGDSRCAGQYAKEVINHPGGTSDVDLSVMVDGDEFGYKCTAGAQTFIPGDVVEGWSGDETVWQKNPPFPVKLYGESYTSAWISANGLISFKDPAYFGWIGSIPGTIPSPAAEGSPTPPSTCYWDDWVVDSAGPDRHQDSAARHRTGSGSWSGATSTPTATPAPAPPSR